MSVEPDIPAHLTGYVDALGVDGAVKFLCEFGGSEVYIATTPTGRSKMVRAIGVDNVEKLAGSLGAGYYKVPIAKRWVAQSAGSPGPGAQGPGFDPYGGLRKTHWFI